MSAIPAFPWIEPAPTDTPAPQWSRFHSLPTGVVVEAARKLMWSAHGMDMARSWDDANHALTASRLAGHDDWRLPTINELLGLVDWQRHDPAIDIHHFSALSNWYWTITPVADVTDCCWFVDFSRGLADFHPKSTRALVRAVRNIE